MSIPLRAVLALVAPFDVGGVVDGAIRLADATVDGDGARYVLRGAGDEVTLLVLPRDDARPVLTRTARLDVVVKADREVSLSPAASRAVVAIVRALRKNEAILGVLSDTAASPAPGVEASDAATLWLLPGHLGDPLDLPLRAARVLRASTLWIVERGKQSEALRLAAVLGVEPHGRMLEIDAEPSDALVPALAPLASSGGHACMFGVDEGIPGFLDPGAAVVGAALRTTPPMRVRSIGGASVLGTALMRVGCVVNDFTFFGRITPDRAEADLLSKLRALGTLRQAWIWFSDADALHGTLDTLGRQAARVHAGIAVLADLTMPTESVAVWLPGEQPAPPLVGSRFVVMLLTRGQALQIVDR